MPSATLTRKKTWTDHELETLPADGQKYELVDGELSMSPVTANHGAICVRLDRFNRRVCSATQAR
jgi:hypothetical protein